MAVTTDRQYQQILTTSLAQRSKEIQDLVFNSNPLTAILRENGAYRPYYGPEIRVPLMIDKLDGQWFTGYDKLRIDPKEIINSAVFTPKSLAVSFSLTGTELLANEGEARVFDLLEQYMENAERSMADLMEESIYGDGTGNGGRSIIGLNGAIPVITNAGVYGGIDRSLHPIWRTTSYDATTDFPDIGTTWDSTTARPILERIVSLRSKGKRRATVAVCGINAYQAISASLVAHQRITSTRLGRLGFDALEIMTPAGPIAIVAATGVGSVMDPDLIFGLDMDALVMYYHPNRNMTPLHDGDGAKPINQDAFAQSLLWNGALALNNPRFTWRLKTA